MKVSELIEALSELDQELEILLQKDGEGNGYSALGCLGEAIVVKEKYEYHVYDLGWSADDCCLDEDEWEQMKSDKSLRMLVLSP